MQWVFHAKAAAYLQATAFRGSVLADGPVSPILHVVPLQLLA